MKADKIVRALRDAEGNNELDCEISELRPLLLKAADLIESLQARLVEYDALAAEYGIDGKTMLTLAKSQIETAKENIVLLEALEESRRKEKAAVEALREQAERSRAKSFNVQSDMFGEHCLVPTGYSKEKHVYKVVTHFQSNSYCEVPLVHDSKPVLHDSVIDVLNVIHCGIDETKVERVAFRDVELCGKRLEVEP